MDRGIFQKNAPGAQLERLDDLSFLDRCRQNYGAYLASDRRQLSSLLAGYTTRSVTTCG